MSEENSPKKEDLNDDNTKSENKLLAFAKSWLPFVAIIAVVYFGNVEIQSYLGRQALDETGLELLSLDQALSKAKRENKLVLADLSAIWCPSCRKLDQDVLANDQVQKAIDQNYVFARIEYESKEGEAFMKKYQVSGFPTLVVIDQNGNKVKKLPLTFSPEQFVSLL